MAVDWIFDEPNERQIVPIEDGKIDRALLAWSIDVTKLIPSKRVSRFGLRKEG
jgi:hypothetical protein